MMRVHRIICLSIIIALVGEFLGIPITLAQTPAQLRDALRTPDTAVEILGQSDIPSPRKLVVKILQAKPEIKTTDVEIITLLRKVYGQQLKTDLLKTDLLKTDLLAYGEFEVGFRWVVRQDTTIILQNKFPRLGPGATPSYSRANIQSVAVDIGNTIAQELAKRLNIPKGVLTEILNRQSPSSTSLITQLENLGYNYYYNEYIPKPNTYIEILKEQIKLRAQEWIFEVDSQKAESIKKQMFNIRDDLVKQGFSIDEAQGELNKALRQSGQLGGERELVGEQPKGEMPPQGEKTIEDMFAELEKNKKAKAKNAKYTPEEEALRAREVKFPSELRIKRLELVKALQELGYSSQEATKKAQLLYDQALKDANVKTFKDLQETAQKAANTAKEGEALTKAQKNLTQAIKDKVVALERAYTLLNNVASQEIYRARLMQQIEVSLSHVPSVAKTADIKVFNIKPSDMALDKNGKFLGLKRTLSDGKQVIIKPGEKFSGADGKVYYVLDNKTIEVFTPKQVEIPSLWDDAYRTNNPSEYQARFNATKKLIQELRAAGDIEKAALYEQELSRIEQQFFKKNSFGQRLFKSLDWFNPRAWMNQAAALLRGIGQKIGFAQKAPEGRILETGLSKRAKLPEWAPGALVATLTFVALPVGMSAIEGAFSEAGIAYFSDAGLWATIWGFGSGGAKALGYGLYELAASLAAGEGAGSIAAILGISAGVESASTTLLGASAGGPLTVVFLVHALGTKLYGLYAQERAHTNFVEFSNYLVANGPLLQRVNARLITHLAQEEFKWFRENNPTNWFTKTFVVSTEVKAAKAFAALEPVENYFGNNPWTKAAIQAVLFSPAHDAERGELDVYDPQSSRYIRSKRLFTFHRDPQPILMMLQYAKEGRENMLQEFHKNELTFARTWVQNNSETAAQAGAVLDHALQRDGGSILLVGIQEVIARAPAEIQALFATPESKALYADTLKQMVFTLLQGKQGAAVFASLAEQCEGREVECFEALKQGKLKEEEVLQQERLKKEQEKGRVEGTFAIEGTLLTATILTQDPEVQQQSTRIAFLLPSGVVAQDASLLIVGAGNGQYIPCEPLAQDSALVCIKSTGNMLHGGKISFFATVEDVLKLTQPLAIRVWRGQGDTLRMIAQGVLQPISPQEEPKSQESLSQCPLEMSITLLNMDEAGLEKYVEDILARPKEQPDKGQLLALVACLEKYFPSSSFYNKFQQIIKGEILPSQP